MKKKIKKIDQKNGLGKNTLKWIDNELNIMFKTDRQRIKNNQTD